MKRRMFIAASGTATVTLLSGCGGGSSEPERPDNEQWAKDYTWEPLKLEVDPGTTVTWVNQDSFRHTVTSAKFHDAAEEWDFDEDLSAGEEANYTFEEAGIYEHYSSAMGDGGESGMCGSVLVGDVSLDAELPCAGDQ